MNEEGYGGAYTGAQIDSAIAKILSLTPSKALTLAEYNALSEAEKQSETVYIITDDNTP